MGALRGRIRGKTIELEQEPGLPEGQAVAVQIQALVETKPAAASSQEAPPPWWLEPLDVDPNVVRGRVIIKGTRLQAETLVALREEGRAEEELLRTYPDLTREDVAAVREYGKAPLGLRRSFGAWAEDAEELDKFLEETYRLRGAPHRRIGE